MGSQTSRGSNCQFIFGVIPVSSVRCEEWFRWGQHPVRVDPPNALDRRILGAQRSFEVSVKEKEAPCTVEVRGASQCKVLAKTASKFPEETKNNLVWHFPEESSFHGQKIFTNFQKGDPLVIRNPSRLSSVEMTFTGNACVRFSNDASPQFRKKTVFISQLTDRFHLERSFHIDS
jgi:hypothetical protein